MREANRTDTGRFAQVNSPSEIGQRFGRLVVLERAGTSKCGSIILRCRCDCGNETRSWSTTLRDGTAQSCGCLNEEHRITACTRHGHSSRKTGTTPEYRCWSGMIERCQNPNTVAYKDYGGRGITICERWRDFRNFLADMGARPKGTTLDRVEVNGNYEKSNCRWAVPDVQNNNKRNSILIECFGKIQSLAQWAHETGIDRQAIIGRLAHKWPLERALTEPSRRLRQA